MSFSLIFRNLTPIAITKCSVGSHQRILSSCTATGVRWYANEAAQVEESAMKKGLGEVNQNIFGSLRRPKKRPIDESRSRKVPVPWEVSLRYMESNTYKETYRGYKVWELFRRQHRGPQHNPPRKTRVTCIKDGYVQGASPCPICRDKYLVLHFKNVLLLEQFVAPWSGKVLEPRKTNLCQMRHEELLVALYLARDHGTMSFAVPRREFDYEQYYLPEQLEGLDLVRPADVFEDPVLEKVKETPEFGSQHKYTLISYPI